MWIYKIIFAVSALVLIALASPYSFANEEAITADQASVKCGTFAKKHQNGQRLAVVPPYIHETGLQKTYASPSGKFFVHYDTTGENAVANIDTDHNGIPDFVDSAAYYLDYVYDIYINQMGYKPPYPDNGLGGSDAVDVYLVDIGNGDSGNTFYGFTESDVPIEEYQGAIPRFASFMVFDNNYSPQDTTVNLETQTKVRTYSSLGIIGLKITIAHEFYHVIQFSYGMDNTSDLLNEMASTFMEWRIFPEIKDYIGFVRRLFRTPTDYNFGSGSGSEGYFFAIFGQYLYRNYGDALLRRMWEILSEQVGGYLALDYALKEKGSSLPLAWCDFMKWIYYSGPRTQGDKYLTDAALFPDLKFYNSDNNNNNDKELAFVPPSVTFTGNLRSFEFRPFRTVFVTDDPAYSTNDTVDALIANNDFLSVTTQNIKPFLLIYSDNQIPDSQPLDGTKYFYTFKASLGGICDNNLFIHPGKSLNQRAYAFPDPFRPGRGDSQILFPAPRNSRLDDNVTLTVFNSEIHRVYEAVLKVSVSNDSKVINWTDVPSDISSGVYIFNIKYKDQDDIIGKFAVIR